MQELSDSFWGHVNDLRQTLLRTVLIIAVGFAAVLSFYQPFLRFLTSLPLEYSEGGVTKQKVERLQAVNLTGKDQSFQLPADAVLVSSAAPDGQKGSHPHYLLRSGETLIYDQTIQSPLLIMGPIEGLALVFKACFWLSIALTAPVWGWVWLQFILPGIKARERAILIPFLLCSLACLACGCALAYFITLPIANEYLSLFNSSIGQNAWTLNHYLNYVLFLCLGHAIAAELSLLLLALVHFRLLSPEWLISKRRYMIVGAFIAGALLTPPDVLTQLLLAFPLMGIYEIAICYAKWRKRPAIADKISF